MTAGLGLHEVEVCADCLTRECLDGVNVCPQSKLFGSDSTVKTVAELRQLALESPEAWAIDRP